MIINNSITPPTAPPIIATLSELLPLSLDTGVSNKTTLSYALYSAKQWREKFLANLVNLEQFVKVLPIQIYIIKLRVDYSMTNEYQANSKHAWKLQVCIYYKFTWTLLNHHYSHRL